MFFGVLTGIKTRSRMIQVVLMTFVLAACVSCGGLSLPSPIDATAQAETALTEAHGVEVSRVIENFESKWLSLTAYKDPSVQGTLAVNPFLDYFGIARHGAAIYNWPSWSATKSASIKSLRVLEYSVRRFEAIAKVVKVEDEVTPQGTFISSSSTLPQCTVYVFVRDGDNDLWKLASAFSMTDMDHIERDWNSAAEWQKQIIGDLPNEGCD